MRQSMELSESQLPAMTSSAVACAAEARGNRIGPPVSCTFDGACQPYNPGGHMGLGWVIDGVVHSEYIPAAYRNTNNVAEYLALIRILDDLANHPEIDHAAIAGDSQLVICQLSGEYAVRSASIHPLWQEAQGKIAALRSRGCAVGLRWHSRDCNELADAASKAALAASGVVAAERTPPAGWTDRLGDIGDRLGLSAVKVGKLLAAAGLRSGIDATEKAVADGYARRRFNGFGWTVDWHEEMCVALAQLEREGGQETVLKSSGMFWKREE